jgi:hypothetical protein
VTVHVEGVVVVAGADHHDFHAVAELADDAAVRHHGAGAFAVGLRMTGEVQGGVVAHRDDEGAVG